LKASSDKAALYDELVATIPTILRKGDTVAYTSHNGHMFSYLSKNGTLALRLPDGARQAFLKKYKTGLCKQYGIIQKEYVEVPDALFRKTAELRNYFASSLAYVRTLKKIPKGKK
jgi:hypothetical protein